MSLLCAGVSTDFILLWKFNCDQNPLLLQPSRDCSFQQLFPRFNWFSFILLDWELQRIHPGKAWQLWHWGMVGLEGLRGFSHPKCPRINLDLIPGGIVPLSQPRAVPSPSRVRGQLVTEPSTARTNERGANSPHGHCPCHSMGTLAGTGTAPSTPRKTRERPSAVGWLRKMALSSKTLCETPASLSWEYLNRLIKYKKRQTTNK